VRKVGGDNPLEFRDELVHALRWQIELKSLTATGENCPKHWRENTGPAFLHRFDEEREMVRTRQEARRRQLPCSVKDLLREGGFIVARFGPEPMNLEPAFVRLSAVTSSE